MLNRACGNAVRGEQPIDVARPGAIEAELDGCLCERRDDTGFEIDLQIQDEIELPRRQLAPNVEKTAPPAAARSEEHTSELQSLMRTSYAGFCLKKKKNNN